MSEITIFLEWDSCQPDNRQYKQPSQVLLPKLLIAVDVPLKHKYIHNSEVIITTQVAATEFDENVPQPVLTPSGMRYVVDQLEAQFQPEDEITADDFKNGGWDDDETETASSDDGWGDDEETAPGSHGWDDKVDQVNDVQHTPTPSDDTEGWGDETEKSDDFDPDDEWGDE